MLHLAVLLSICLSISGEQPAGQLRILEESGVTGLPTSFVYGGASSEELLSEWPHTLSETQPISGGAPLWAYLDGAGRLSGTPGGDGV